MLGLSEQIFVYLLLIAVTLHQQQEFIPVHDVQEAMLGECWLMADEPNIYGSSIRTYIRLVNERVVNSMSKLIHKEPRYHRKGTTGLGLVKTGLNLCRNFGWIWMDFLLSKILAVRSTEKGELT